MAEHNFLTWFEVPVNDMDRAVKFYETVFQITLTRQPMGPLEMALFPGDPQGAGASGSLVRHDEFYKPSRDGVLAYFASTSGDLSQEQSRIADVGGEVLIPKRQISEEVGYMAVCLDSEGNRIALHSPK